MEFISSSFCIDNVREFLTHFNSKALARLENFGVSAGWSHMEAPLSEISPHLYLIKCN